MEDNKDRKDSPQEMKLSALSILERIKSTDNAYDQSAMDEYASLVRRFYRDNQNLMAPQQYRAARQDFEYFMRLLDLAIHYSATSGQSDKGST
jgi:hypothetical protein